MALVMFIHAETRDFHSRCGIGEEGSLGNDAHLIDQFGTKISGFTPSYEALGHFPEEEEEEEE